jgi:hypothetical protein
VTRARLAFAAASVACVLGAVSLAEARSTAPPLRVLFVGNSLTATNNLPDEVSRLARAGGRPLETGMIAHGGFALEDHWNRGDVRQALTTGDWDVVVMQQGPSALPEGRVNLSTWAAQLAAEARAAGTAPALLTVWPESYRRNALSDVRACCRRPPRERSDGGMPAAERCGGT